jgi:DNA-binding NarL/FixJ family response regulator
VPTKILVVDDFERWRLTVRSILEDSEDFLIIGEAGDGLEGIEKAVSLRPDIVLLDIGMPGLDGIEAGKRIRQKCPECKIIFLTQLDDWEIRNSALSTGAEAYLLKSRAARDLRPAIEKAAFTGSQNQAHDQISELCEPRPQRSHEGFEGHHRSITIL